MSLERLIDEMDARARIEADVLHQQAETEAAAIREEARRARTAELDARLASLEREERAAAEARIADAHRRTAAESLASRDAFLTRVIAAVEAQLQPAAAAPAFRSALPALLDEALEFRGDASAATLRAGPSLLDALRPLAAKHGLALEAVDGPRDGFILACGRVAIEQTLSARLRQRLPELRQWIAARAAGGAACAGKT